MNATEPSPAGLKRRGFLGAALLSAGAGMAVLIRKTELLTPAPAKVPALDNRFSYDLSQFESTDPKLLCYRPSHSFSTGFQTVTRVAGSPEGLWVGGDQAVKFFSRDGALQREVPLGFRPHAMLPWNDGRLFVAAKNFVAVVLPDGQMNRLSQTLDPQTYFTALAVCGSFLYLADAGKRQVAVCDLRNGAVVDQFGAPGDSRNNPGFAIPSPYFDLRVTSDDTLRISNTGRMRIETYTLDGQFRTSWGEPGMAIDRFCGCCNPVYFALTRRGDFVTSEKGLARINLYSAEGRFQGAVAGSETLVRDKELARRACVDCHTGAGFDVDVDDQDRVFALDPYEKLVRCFIPLRA